MIPLEIQFLGGASEVGRQAFLLKDSKNILLDYGIKVNNKIEYPLLPGRVDACILSHAHLDHSGAFPTLYQSSFPVSFGTRPTLELSELLIEDSMGIAKKQNIKPKFSKRQLKDFMNKYVWYSYGSQIDFGEYNITLYDAGHITGSSVTLIEKKKTGKRLVYTGDFKLEPQFLQGSADIVKSDILIIESTYATREHPDRDKIIRDFVADVRATTEEGGTALIPCFAVGRAQEIIALLYKNNLMDYTYMDGMARKATEVVMRHPEFTRNEPLLMSAMKSVIWVNAKHDKISALNGPSIIVTTAGMLNGGPVLNYITKINPKSRIMLTGYQVEGTNGRKLLEGRPITIENRKYSIKNPVSYYDFSAHSGKTDLHEYVKGSSPEKVFCVHGDQENTQEFAESLKLEGFDAYAPKLGERVQIEF